MSPRSAGCLNSFTGVLARLRAKLARVRRSLTTVFRVFRFRRLLSGPERETKDEGWRIGGHVCPPKSEGRRRAVC